MAYQTDKQLQNAILNDLREVIDYMITQIYKYNQEVIKDVVYNVYEPVLYDRTPNESESFLGAWTQDGETVITGKHVRGTFEYDPSNLTDNGFMAHRAKEALAEIIYEGLSGNFKDRGGYAKYDPAFRGQAWTKKRDAWKKLLNGLGTRRIKKYFREGCAKQGIKLLDLGTIERTDYE